MAESPVRFNAAFALFLERERERAGLTQQKLADLLHLSRSTVTHWEAATRTPTAESLEQLCEVLRLDMPTALRLMSRAAADIKAGEVGSKAMQRELDRVAEKVSGGWRRRKKPLDDSDEGGGSH